MLLTKEQIKGFEKSLMAAERSHSTVRQYTRTIDALCAALGGVELTRAALLSYKEQLMKKYAPASVNAAIAAVNAFLSYIGLDGLRLGAVRMQRRTYADTERELKKNEYKTLLEAAEGKPRLKRIVQTLGSAGICVSELRFITVEAVRTGRAEIDCKGKHRTVLLPKKLCRALAKYAKALGIRTGSIFITRNGNPVDRSNLAKELKRLAKKAGVNKKKVFAHNFRHFFARLFYNRYKDIVRLADILGHSSINTTRIYTMESGEVHRRRLDRLCAELE